MTIQMAFGTCMEVCISMFLEVVVAGKKMKIQRVHHDDGLKNVHLIFEKKFRSTLGDNLNIQMSIIIV